MTDTHYFLQEDDRRNGRLFVCYPLLTGNGSKYSAVNLAHSYLQLHPDKKVALVDFDFHFPALFGEQTDHDRLHGIDNLIDKIDGGQLTQELFLENMLELKTGVFILKGTDFGVNHAVIQRHHIEQMMSHLKNAFDAVFIVTTNRLDNAGTVYGLHEADEVILIVKNNYSNYRYLDAELQKVKHLYHQDTPIKLMYNQFNAQSKYDFGDWCAAQGVEGIGAIPYDETTTDNVNLVVSGLSGLLRRGKNKQASPFDAVIDTLFPEED